MTLWWACNGTSCSISGKPGDTTFSDRIGARPWWPSYPMGYCWVKVPSLDIDGG